MGELPSKVSLEDLLSNKPLVDEINNLSSSDKDVTWGENMVMLVLRSQDEVRKAQLLQLNPVGTTLVIMRKDGNGNPVHDDETIRKAIQVIKGTQAE